MRETVQFDYDAVVVGGGPAGLAGALMLGRSRRSVLVVDDGVPRNAAAAGVHGYLSRDGIAPAELRRIARDEVRGYGVELRDGRATSARRHGGAFVVEFAAGESSAGETVRARRLLITTGLTDRLPELPGLAERWGRDVLHCPYCHGWEVRDQAVIVLGLSSMSTHQVQLFRQLTDRVTYLVHEAPALEPEQLERLTARGVTVVEQRAVGLEVRDDALRGIRLADGEVLAGDALVIGAPAVANSPLLVGLGVQPEPHPSGLGEFIPADEVGQTVVPGVYVAGNVSNIAAQVSSSTAAGALAGAHINADLVRAEFGAAVAATREIGVNAA